MRSLRKLICVLALTPLLVGCGELELEIKVPQSDSNISLVSETKGHTTQVESVTEVQEDIQNTLGYHIAGDVLTYLGEDYTIVEVEGGDRSGDREPNVAVDIGFGDREYWGLTNEYGQLIHVLAEEVSLQDDEVEPVNDDGRYYSDEADVPGTELDTLDQGHVIADSLGGVANAYNITPQDSVLNRHGEQAYMESAIRDAGGCANLEVTISYSETDTQIPNSYRYEYELMGNLIVDDFENKNPEETVNAVEESSAGVVEKEDVGQDLSGIDTNGNGIVTIKEAEAAGYAMPIKSDHWLYQYMKDNDGDGMVGE